MQRQHAHLCAFLLLAIFAGGCASVDYVSNKFTGDQEKATPQLLLVYQTDYDRLVASSGSNSLVQPTGYTEQAPSQAFSQVFVEVNSPHPAGRVGFAQVRVTFADEDQQSLLGGEAATQAESWVMDVPLDRVNNLVEELRENGFFRSSRVLNAKAELYTEIEGDTFGKPCQEISELDAVIVSIRQQGRREGASQARLALERMPSIY